MKSTQKTSSDNSSPDVILIGAGIMSATLGVFLKELDPEITIEIFERLDRVAGESSNGWNNAGTGHSAFCELNYSPEKPDGSIDISKALKIASSFEISKQFWSYLVEKKYIGAPGSFIHGLPHISFVWGDENVAYMKKRFEAMRNYPLFSEMEYSEDPEVLTEWMPLVMEGRDKTQKVAATRMKPGTDIDFGALTRELFAHLEKQNGITLHLNTEVRDIDRDEKGKWNIEVKDVCTKEKTTFSTDFVFIGAGGGSLHLLDKSNIEEADGYGGFPISGQFLNCTNEKIIEQHHAKVYGKATVGSPPMSVPHLDSRIIDGKKGLLFGPFAGFSTKFLKKGSYFDLLKSVELGNIYPILSAGIHNIPLTKYLIQQVRQRPWDRIDALRLYFPKANSEDWELITAGQRVQVIKKDDEEGGVLEFGTEVVHSKDGSICALLGASPGASVSVSIMLEVLNYCFGNKMNSESWKTKLQEMIPVYGRSLVDNPGLCHDAREKSKKVLNLTEKD
jgi:malate dehydrogenase (quinone)